MATTSASPQTTEPAEKREWWSRRTSRFGRRVVGLFVLSALVPLILCAALLHGQLSSALSLSERTSLDGLVRSFGMILLAQLGSADDELKVITTAVGATDEQMQTDIEKLPWVGGVRRVTAETLRTEQVYLPTPNDAQVRALSSRGSAVLWSVDPRGDPKIYLVRTLPGGSWSYVEIRTAWLWADAKDFAGDANLVLLDDRGRQLAATASPSALGLDPRATGWAMTRSWEIFLASRFSSPSWHLVAVGAAPGLLTFSNQSYLYLSSLILITILFVTWLSMWAIRRKLRPLDELTRAAGRIAHRDFDAFRDMFWDDEFGDLAQAFRAMADKLKAQFAALETLADVDRLLLSTPRLELILDTLLPHLAQVLHCDCISVVLFDSDSDQRACVHDYYAAQSQQLPVRRLSSDTAALRAACSGSSAIDMETTLRLPCFEPLRLEGITRVSLLALTHEGACAGVLCIGYINKEPAETDESPVSAGDFADRLSLILTSLKQTERLHYQANYDLLTGLQNRHLFAHSVRDAITAAAESGTTGGLLYIDLDLFKRVNDTAGHAAGDSLLRIVAERLKGCVDKSSSIARLGGDEFAVLLPASERRSGGAQTAQRIISALQPPIVIDSREHRVSASIGIAEFPADGTTLDELLKAGDIAMYNAKEAGRGQAVFFRREMQQKVAERDRLERALRRALRDRQLALHYQPIVSERGAGAVAIEALVRWPGIDPGTWVAPAGLISVAEENGLIVELGEWVLRSACEQFAQWRRAGLQLEYVSVNVSVRQLKEPDYLSRLLAALRDSGLQARELQVEITESVLAHGTDVRATLTGIATQGVRLALDDFGTGYSSLSYVHSYPFHTVKIDRAFVSGLPGDMVSCRLAESIIVMCTALGMSVVAEGVETEAQREFLRRVGCTTIQGYLVARPMAASGVPEFVRGLSRAREREVLQPGSAVPLPMRESA